MAKKTRYCEHEPKTEVFNRSRSSRFVCCKECYLAEIRKVLIESFDLKFVQKLDWIKTLDFSKHLKNVPESMLTTKSTGSSAG